MRRYFQVVVLAVVLGLTSLLVGTPADSTHVIQSGETLETIARKYGLATETLAEANKLKNPDRLAIGQKLTIPSVKTGAAGGKGKTYLVKAGDTLGAIAQDHGVSPIALSGLNRIEDANSIKPGQVLVIPDAATSSAAPAAKATTPLPASVKKELDALRVVSGKWRYIVIHHSATRNGSAKGMDEYHRKKRRMENGLAYHFVIGNGMGMRDGEIAIGNRWKKQIKGGHLASPALNEKSIGICLVGNFETTRPTAQQLKSLYALVNYLETRCKSHPDAVKLHREINTKPTKCPGKNFPARALAENT